MSSKRIVGPQYLPVPLLWLLNSEPFVWTTLIRFCEVLATVPKSGAAQSKTETSRSVSQNELLFFVSEFPQVFTMIVINLLIGIFLAHILKRDTSDRKDAYKYNLLSPKPRIKLMV